jgi:hypothetical protein
MSSCAPNHRVTHALIALGLTLSALIYPVRIFAQDNVYHDDVVTLTFIENIFGTVLGIIIRLIGVAVFGMLLYGGFTYLFSGGSKEGTAKARSTITWAVGGLAAVFLAWFVLLFLSKITGNQALLEFDFFFIP